MQLCGTWYLSSLTECNREDDDHPKIVTKGLNLTSRCRRYGNHKVWEKEYLFLSAKKNSVVSTVHCQVKVNQTYRGRTEALQLTEFIMKRLIQLMNFKQKSVKDSKTYKAGGKGKEKTHCQRKELAEKVKGIAIIYYLNSRYTSNYINNIITVFSFKGPIRTLEKISGRRTKRNDQTKRADTEVSRVLSPPINLPTT